MVQKMNKTVSKFIEDAKLSGIKKTKDGYLTGFVYCARTGIQIYTGDEVGRPDLETVRVYRPPEEVFAKDSLATIAGKPLTNNHPDEDVTAENWKDHAVGSIGNEVLRDGEKMKVPFMLMDAAAVADVENGKRELSNGYNMTLVFDEGVTPEGEAYDAKQTNIKMNHVAIVKRGRAGHECRIGDDAGSVKWGASPITIDDEETKVTDKLRTVIVDALPVVTTDAGAAAIDKLTKDNAALQAKLDAQSTAHDTAMAAKDADLDKKNDEIKKLNDSKLDQSAIDAKVAARTTLLSDAKLLAKDADFTGKDDNDVRKTAVTAVRGADAVADKSDDYITAAFDLAVADAKADDKTPASPVQGAFKSVYDGQPQTQANDNGQEDYEKSLRDAYKTEV